MRKADQPGAYARSRRNAFAGLLLDRATEARSELIGRLSERPQLEVLVDPQGNLLVARTERREAASGLWPRPIATESDDVFLGFADERAYFARLIDGEAREHEAAARDAEWMDLRRFALAAENFQGGVAAYGRAMLHWNQRHRYCGVCGSANRRELAGHRMRCSNELCQAETFPRTDPAIIVLVQYGQSVLLGRQSVWPQKRYSALAGFVEPGESLEDAVVREVFEESGVRVHELEYFASQPWPFPSSLMLGFHAETNDPSVLLGSELEDVRWFEPDQFIDDVRSAALLPPPPVSIAFRLIESWLHSVRQVDLMELCGWR
jgi:NAD+ diphosphatase